MLLANQLILLLGSNLNNRQALLKQAQDLLAQQVLLLKASALYESAPWGLLSQDPFLNQALWIQTQMSAHTLLDFTQQIENQLGRQRTQKWGARTIDIDLIYWGKQVVQEENLQIPHLLIAQRRFVLAPIVELMPDFLHPVLQKTQKELLQSCPDEGWVRKLPS